MKKVLALSLAAVMVLVLCGAAFAGEEFTSPKTFISTAETSITVRGLEDGDSAEYFQILEWQGTTVGTSEEEAAGGWKFVSPMPGSTGLTVADILDGITAEEAAKIANVYEGQTGTNMSGTGTVTATVEPGLYYVRAIATSDDTIYNPIFVGADNYSGNNDIDVSEMTIGSSAVLKKSTVTFDKQVGHTTESYDYRDVAPGAYIPYKITTTIPAYGAAYDNAQFEITDTFSTGLVLAIDDDHPFTVTVSYGTNGTQAGVDEEYTTTAANNASTYKITFDKKYLLDPDRTPTTVTVTYWGLVTTAAPQNVNPLDNTADLEYSNKPDDTTWKHDRTRHYTFSIDATILGDGGYKTSELLKIGLDQNGNPVSELIETVHSLPTAVLEGATFTLSPVTSTGAAFGSETVPTVVSTSDGRLEFHGLDAGTYMLVEDSAPDGYVKDGTTYYVKITPTYASATSDVLVSYTISWSNNGTDFSDITTFVMTNNGEIGWSEKVDGSADATAHGSIPNRQGAELPSTGGIGTTIFYVTGLLMVLGAGTVLVARRKADEE